jgi:hypothetical protein
MYLAVVMACSKESLKIEKMAKMLVLRTDHSKGKQLVVQMALKWVEL